MDELNDIIIVGAGPVGSLAAVLARQARPDLRIKILDRDSAPTESGKTVALTFSSRRILEDAGVWDSISNCVAPIIEARTTYQRCFGRGIIRAADADVDALGYAIPLSILHRAIRKFADDLLVAPATLQSIEKKGGGIELKIAKESGETESLLCRLLILAAEFSPPILPADFSAHSFAYKQAAISCEAHADNLLDGESHERFASGGVIAIVPRREESSDKNCALIWCAPTDSALHLSQMDDASFIAAVGEECGGATPLIVSVGPRRAHKLQMADCPPDCARRHFINRSRRADGASYWRAGIEFGIPRRPRIFPHPGRFQCAKCGRNFRAYAIVIAPPAAATELALSPRLMDFPEWCRCRRLRLVR